MDSEKSILMYYHTALRNVGLLTSISFVLLGSSRFYRGKNNILNILFFILSLIILLGSIIICKYLMDDLKIMKQNLDEVKYLNKWEKIPEIIYYVNISVGLIGITNLLKYFL
tara:strand:- start:4568 stop:4903 length:336 start_codon:yes stop_codon:yes gene_type:complete